MCLHNLSTNCLISYQAHVHTTCPVLPCDTCPVAANLHWTLSVAVPCICPGCDHLSSINCKFLGISESEYYKWTLVRTQKSLIKVMTLESINLKKVSLNLTLWGKSVSECTTLKLISVHKEGTCHSKLDCFHSQNSKKSWKYIFFVVHSSTQIWSCYFHIKYYKLDANYFKKMCSYLQKK